MSRCVIDSDLLFPSLCWMDKLDAGEGISHIFTKRLLDSGCSSSLSPLTSSIALELSPLLRPKDQIWFKDLKQICSLWQWPMFKSSTFFLCSRYNFKEMLRQFAQPSSSNDFFFSYLAQYTEQNFGTRHMRLWVLTPSLATWDWWIHLHFDLVPFCPPASSWAVI